MARRVFFSFHYQRDIVRVNQIRNAHQFIGTAAAGFQDASLWEATKRQGDAAIRRLINQGLEGTSVTAVLIGAQTAQRTYVDYEIEQSLVRGNGLLGVHISHLKDWNGFADYRGQVPWRLVSSGYPVIDWSGTDDFAWWIEHVYDEAQKRKRAAEYRNYF